MSSFAVANLISKEHKPWVLAHMEPDSYLLDLNEKWLCYLTARDNDLCDYLIPQDDILDGLLALDPPRKRVPSIPASVAAISQQAPVFYLQHPEDHAWMYAAISKGEVVGSLVVDYESAQVTEDNGFQALSLFGFGEDIIAELRKRINVNAQDFNVLFSMSEILNSALNCAIDFTSYDYVQDYPDGYPVIAKGSAERPGTGG